MFIFTLLIGQVITQCLAQRTYHCDSHNEYTNYITCLNEWRVVRESSRGHSIFLKEVDLIDDICILPSSPSISKMDKCVTMAVSPFCESFLAHWQGLKQFLTYLCEYREAFEGKFARCRKNLDFQSAYETCMSSHVREVNAGEDNCESYRELQKCLDQALNTYCSERAAEFFSLAFSTRDAPLIAHSCKQASPIYSDYVFDIQSDIPSDKRGQERDSQRDLPPRASKIKKFRESNLEVAPANNSNSVILNLTALYLMFLFLRIL